MQKTGNQRLRTLAAPCLLALALGGFGALAHAVPNDEVDPVVKLLTDKGLLTSDAAMPPLNAPADALPKKGTSLAAQVRDRASDMVLTAMNFLGVPYRLGGTGADTGFDCSGFTRHIFERSLGLVLPRRADEQASAKGLVQIQREELRPGDLVFFNTLRRTFSHVGIYVGDGKFIHSPSRGGKVRVEDMGMSYWKARFTGARRVDASGNETTTASSR